MLFIITFVVANVAFNTFWFYFAQLNMRKYRYGHETVENLEAILRTIFVFICMMPQLPFRYHALYLFGLFALNLMMREK